MGPGDDAEIRATAGKVEIVLAIKIVANLMVNSMAIANES